MAPSAPSPRIGRGSLDSALTLKKNHIPHPDDSRPAEILPGVAHPELPEVVPHADALDARWQSAIDAATD